MKVAYHPSYVHPVPQNHRFPMEKYRLISEQLIYEGIISENQFISPASIELEHVYRVHDFDYIKKLLDLELTAKEQRQTGFVHCTELIQRELRIMEGTRICAEHALSDGCALNIAGGTHHAFSNRGEGFCLLNDQAIAAAFLKEKYQVKNILIIDLDVHQGNGTAEIFRNDKNIFTFSMHGKDNYPLKKEISDLDVELPLYCEDDQYLELLENALKLITNKFDSSFVFYQCGVDILKTDKLGLLSISEHACRDRDNLVFEFVKKRGLPIVCSMGGGYSPKIKDVVNAHMQTFRQAAYFFD